MTNQDPTNADRQRRIRNRKTYAYIILKDLAVELGAMQDHNDLDGFDAFMETFVFDAPVIDHLLNIQKHNVPQSPATQPS